MSYMKFSIPENHQKQQDSTTRGPSGEKADPTQP